MGIGRSQLVHRRVAHDLKYGLRFQINFSESRIKPQELDGVTVRPPQPGDWRQGTNIIKLFTTVIYDFSQ